MASKSDLEARETECQSVQDYCNLALEALAEPKDEAYAKELLDTAEGDCSFPKDYISVAEVYIKLDNKEQAEEMYEEAEDACFEAMETAELGHSIAVHLGDKEKAKELLENAANDAKKITEFLTISSYVREDLQDKELAKSLLDKVTNQCKELDDYKNIAQTIIKEQNDLETAKSFFVKAENIVDGIEKTVEYANTIVELFNDKELATETLEEVEDDAQFTKDFVKLAQGFMALSNEEKAKELMESGQEYAMTGEEQIDLAVGYWTLFHDKDAASQGFEKGLNDISDTMKLLEFAKQLATDMQNPDLAKKYYERAESKMSSAKDLTSLAKAVIDDLKDKDYALGIYQRAEQSMESPSELIILANEVLTNIGDKNKVKQIYQKAFDKTEKFKAYLDLFDDIIAKINDKEFGKEILEKAFNLAETTPELLEIGKKATAVISDKEFARLILEKAEEVVTSLEQMKNVNSTVKEFFSEDVDWIKRVDEKLEKREQNQEKYEEYRKIEESAKTFKDLRLLIENMMAELDDKYYAKKLLLAGKDILDANEFDLFSYKKLIQTITKHLKDDKWISDILDNLIKQRVKFFFDYKAVCEIAISDLSDKNLGKSIAINYLKDYEKKLDNFDKKTIYNYTDIAKTVFELLNDTDWALNLLDKASQLKRDMFSNTFIGFLAKLLGNNEKYNYFINEALAGLNTAEQFYMLANRFLSLNFEIEEIKKLYTKGLQQISDPKEKLLWAEGIINLFGDIDLAKDVYKQIASNYKSDDDKEIFNISKKISLENKFW